MSVFDSVLLPEPFGPMTACTSPRLSPSETPRRISRPSTETCRSLIAKSANFLPHQVLSSSPPGGGGVGLGCGVDVIRAARVAGSQPARPHDGGSQQPPVEILLVAAGMAPARRHVLDRAVAVPE